MAHLWLASANRDGWIPAALNGRTRLSARGIAEATGEANQLSEPAACLVPSDASPDSLWAIVADDSRVSVNGDPLRLGIRRLRDRDEILLQDSTDAAPRRFYFSTEQRVAIEALPLTVIAVCPRCKEALVARRPAVRCPQCRVWHHEDEEAGHPCWTYGERCAACHNQATALDAGFCWTPEHL